MSSPVCLKQDSDPDISAKPDGDAENVKTAAMKECTAAYRQNMEKIMEDSDDDSLISNHQLNAKKACDDFSSRAPFSEDEVMQFKINLTNIFLNIVDSMWSNNKKLCLEALDQIKKKVLRPKTNTGDPKQNYWSALRDIQSEYKSEIGDSLHSKMNFVYLEDLDERQEIDIEALEEELEKRGFPETWRAQRKLLKLQTTWGRLLVFVMHWITSRTKTIDTLEEVYQSLKDKKYSLLLDTDDHEFLKLSLSFANAINKDLRCRKLLLAQLETFVKYVKSRVTMDCLNTEPIEMFLRVSKFQPNISDKEKENVLTPDIPQKESNNSLKICEKIVESERDVKGISLWLANCSSGPLVHLRDVLTKLKDEDKLDKEGLTEVIDMLKEQRVEIASMFSESLRTFFDAFDKVDTSFTKLREDICKWAPKRDESISHLKVLATKLDKTTKDSAIAQVSGSAAGIVGGIVAASGFILAPFTAGISLTATAIAGGIIGGAGALTAVGSTIVEQVIDKNQLEEANKCIEQDQELTKAIEKLVNEFNEISWLILRYIPPDAIEAIFSAARTGLSSSRSKDFIRPIVMNATRLILGTGASVAMPILKSVLKGATNVSKGAAAAITHAVAVVGMLLIILDVHNLVENAKKLNAGAKSDDARTLEEISEELGKAKKELIEVYFDGKLPTDE